MDRNLKNLYIYVLKHGWRIDGYCQSDAYPTGTVIIDLSILPPSGSNLSIVGFSVVLKPNED
jgi:hypothetical protein